MIHENLEETVPDNKMRLIEDAIYKFKEENPDFEVLNRLLSEGVFDIPYSEHHGGELEPLALAIQRGKPKVVAFLVDQAGVSVEGFDAEKAGQYGPVYVNPLAHAFFNNGDFTYPKDPRDEIIEFLLKRGANVNGSGHDDGFRSSPLQAAALYHHMHFIKEFHQRGANVHCKGKDGSTLMHYAICGIPADDEDDSLKEVILWLVGQGVSLSRVNNAGLSASDLAKSRGNKRLAKWIDEIELVACEQEALKVATTTTGHRPEKLAQAQPELKAARRTL